MKFVIALVMTLGLVACNSVEEQEKTLPNNVKENVGKTYELKTVRYTDGTVVYPEKELFLITLADEDMITGKIACNGFSSEVEWTQDEFLILYSYNKSAKNCPDADPLILETKMLYKLSATRLTLQSVNNTWTATFVRVKDED